MDAEDTTIQSSNLDNNQTENNTSTETENTDIKQLITPTNITIFLSFLGIYIGFYFYNKKNSQLEQGSQNVSGSGLIMDILFFIIVGYILYNVYIKYQNSDYTLSSSVVDNSIEFIDNPSSILIIIFVLIAIYSLAFIFKIPMNSANKPISFAFIENTTWTILIVLIFVDFLKYIFNVSFDELFDKLKALLRGEVTTEIPQTKCITDSKEENIDPDAEVFNVSNNLYTYDDAKAVCKVYNAKLATYEQVEDAYNNGAEWCNYGWSEGQLALFPTQKKTWDALQEQDVGVCDNSKKVGNNCGRPGVNGGYIANPYVKFGVNCYGKKPEPTEKELLQMATNKEQQFPLTATDKKLEKKVEYWKKNKNKYLELNSYNTTKWTSVNKTTQSTDINDQTIENN